MIVVFASNNAHKVQELAALLPASINLKSLKDIGCQVEIPETSETIEGNAFQKATFIKEQFGFDCFADDTGLEVEALKGEPGVFSARYAGVDANDKKNVEKLLKAMEGIPDRQARFKTVIALIGKGETKFFEGIVKGSISEYPKGTNGFGYDPVFIPEGETRTFAEMELSEKNKISHRARAVKMLINYFHGTGDQQ
jgi:XTP/dITP diphosphohydrolase